MNLLELFSGSTAWAIESKTLESMVKSIDGRTPDSIASGMIKTEREHEVTRESYLTGKGIAPLEGAFTTGKHGNTAIIPIVGVIRPRPSFSIFDFFGGSSTNLVSLLHDLKLALNDPGVENILLNIDSPGGLASGVAEASEIFREAAGVKNMVAYTSDMMASAAYWLGAAADTIVTSPTALVGSIGVRTTVVDWSAVDAKYGLKEYHIVNRDSPLKGIAPSSEKGREMIQSQVDQLAEIFLDTMADYRGVDRETVNKDFGRGDVLLGASAVENGLADSVGSFEKVLASLNSNTTTNLKGMFAMVQKTDGAPNATAEVTAESVARDYPTIAAAFRAEGHAEGHAEGMQAGAAAERERIQAIETSNPEPEAAEMVAGLKFDPEQNAGTVALAINAARREGNLLTPEQKAQAEAEAAVADDAVDAVEDVNDAAPSAEDLQKSSVREAAERFNARRKA